MVVKTFVCTTKEKIRDSTVCKERVNQKTFWNKNDNSITVETVVKENEMHPLYPNHIVMFPNIESWDEHAQKQKLTGIINSHDLKNTTTEEDYPKKFK